MVAGQQRRAALQQVVGRLAVRSARPTDRRPAASFVSSPSMVPRISRHRASARDDRGVRRALAVRARPAPMASRYGSRSTTLSRGDSVTPGIRPRLAIGPAVDLLDVAGEVDRRRAADVRADGVGIDRGAGILEVADAIRRQTARDGDLDVAGSPPGPVGHGSRGRARPSPGRAPTACPGGCRTADRPGHARRAAPPRPRP